MKKFAWIGLLVVAGLLLTKGIGRAEDVKIGVVDVSKIFSGYTKVAENQVEFDKIQTQRKADVQKKADAAQKEIEALQSKLDKQGKIIKKEESDKITADIEKKRQDIFKLQQEVMQELRAKNQELVEARVKDIEAAIAKLAKEKGYTVVINKEAVLYFPDAADLSDQVITILNKPDAVKK
ncbi:MAG: OmpH family outer membrane protein [Candidatus Ratteibacteria bacterium]|jgi:outer membrane protein